MKIVDDTEPGQSKSALGNAATETILINDEVSPRFNDVQNRFKSGAMTAQSKYPHQGSFSDQTLPVKGFGQSIVEDVTDNVLSPDGAADRSKLAAHEELPTTEK